MCCWASPCRVLPPFSLQNKCPPCPDNEQAQLTKQLLKSGKNVPQNWIQELITKCLKLLLSAECD